MNGNIICINGHDAMDLGLSVQWATCNIGANGAEESGEKYCWGEIEPYVPIPRQGPAFCYYRFDVTLVGKYYRQGYRRKRYMYDGKRYSRINYNISGSDKYDVARNKWGSGWRIPTTNEIEELIRKCMWVWGMHNNTTGYRVIGDNGNSIFLPVTDNEYNIGTYYSSDFIMDWGPYEQHEGACYLTFNKKSAWQNIAHLGYAHLAIRPVISFE